MIEQIHVKNFESHEDSVFDLSPGVNAIVGDSHVGKSAIRRLLHWINTNRPLGNDFIKKGTKRTYARLQFDDGVIERTKSAKTGKYMLDSDPDPFTSFGSGVPEKVTELFNMSDVNFQTQHGSFFLLQDTPGNVASYLRSVTGLDDLTMVSDDISRRLRSAKGCLTTTEGEVSEMMEELEQLERLDVDRLDECIQEYKRLEARNDSIRSDRRSLNRIVERLEDLEAAPVISESRAQELFQRVDELIGAGERIDDRRFQLQAAIDRVREVDVAEVMVREDLLSDVDVVIQQYEENMGKFDTLDGIVKRFKSLQGQELDEKLKVLRVEEKELLGQLEDCPHCGLKLTDEARERLVGDE